MNTIQISQSEAPAVETVKEYRIVIDAKTWSQYLRLKAEKAALEKQVKAIEQGFNLPDPGEFAQTFKLVSGDTVSIPVVNGNGDYMGKIAIYHHDGATIPPGWRKRIS